MSKILVHYVRDGRKPVATIVALDANKFGVSFCNKVDSFLKREGRERAIERAKEGKSVSVPDNIWVNVKWPNVEGRVTLRFAVEQGLKYLKERAERYYKVANAT